MGSLQDALLKSGLTNEEKLGQARKRKQATSQQRLKSQPGAKHSSNNNKPVRSKKTRSKSAGNPTKGSEKSDLEKAWLARRKAEQAEKERVKNTRVADQEARRKRNLKLDKLVEGKVLNIEDAEIPRYFEHLGRIRRVMCSKEQRDGLNQGTLGLVNLRGRYLIVEPDVLQAYLKLAEDLVPDLTGDEPQDASESDDYPPIPDDIAW